MPFLLITSFFYKGEFSVELPETMIFQCEYCGTDLTVPDHSEGLKAKCPGCHNLTAIPGEKLVMDSVQDDPPVEEILHFGCPYCKRETSLKASHNPLGKHKRCSSCAQIFPLTERNLRGASGVAPSLVLGPSVPQKLHYSFDQKSPFQMMGLSFKIFFSSPSLVSLIAFIATLLMVLTFLLAGGFLFFFNSSEAGKSPLSMLSKGLAFLMGTGLLSFASGAFTIGLLDLCKTGSLQIGGVMARVWRKLDSLWFGGVLLGVFIALIQYYGPQLALSFGKSTGISEGTVFYVFVNFMAFGVLTATSLLFVVIVEEDKDPLGGLVRSCDLTKEYLLPIFGFLSMMILPLIVAAAAVPFLLLPLLKGSLFLLVGSLYWILMGGLIALVYSGAAVVVYYNLKSRKGF